VAAFAGIRGAVVNREFRLLSRMLLHYFPMRRRDGRVAEGARLESVFRGNSNVGSNPTLSARYAAGLRLRAGFRQRLALRSACQRKSSKPATHNTMPEPVRKLKLSP
jgi:hypothetical protein